MRQLRYNGLIYFYQITSFGYLKIYSSIEFERKWSSFWKKTPKLLISIDEDTYGPGFHFNCFPDVDYIIRNELTKYFNKQQTTKK
jgi:hypothetical protein